MKFLLIAGVLSQLPRLHPTPFCHELVSACKAGNCTDYCLHQECVGQTSSIELYKRHCASCDGLLNKCKATGDCKDYCLQPGCATETKSQATFNSTCPQCTDLANECQANFSNSPSCLQYCARPECAIQTGTQTMFNYKCKTCSTFYDACLGGDCLEFCVLPECQYAFHGAADLFHEKCDPCEKAFQDCVGSDCIPFCGREYQCTHKNSTTTALFNKQCTTCDSFINQCSPALALSSSCYDYCTHPQCAAQTGSQAVYNSRCHSYDVLEQKCFALQDCSEYCAQPESAIQTFSEDLYSDYCGLNLTFVTGNKP